MNGRHPTPDNLKCAAYGARAVEAGQPDTDITRTGDFATALTDTLTNLRHWAAIRQVTDFDAALASSQVHFDAEIPDEPEDEHIIGDALDYYASDLAERLRDGDYADPEDRAGVERTIARAQAILRERS